MRRPLTIFSLVLLSVFLLGGFFVWHHIAYQAELLRPNVFHGTDQTKWLFDGGKRINFDTHEADLISNWITTHQTGWKFGFSYDFDPRKPQLLCDNYVISINGDMIVFQYYKNQADMANDPYDSFIIIKRVLSPEDQAFWQAQISRVKNDAYYPSKPSGSL